MTVCYLDQPPAVVGERMAPLVERMWSGAPVPPVLAAPFESLVAGMGLLQSRRLSTSTLAASGL